MAPEDNRTETPVGTRVALVAAVLAYALLFGWFYPPIHTSMDEATYLNMAYAFHKGTLYSDVAGVEYSLGFPVSGGHVVGIYPPAHPGLLAVFAAFGWPAVFTANLVLHLAVSGVIICWLRELRLPVLFSLLYLFHPTAVIFSRTVMSDLGSSLLILLATLAHVRSRFVLCGALLGSTLLLRHANLIAVPLLLFGSLFDRSIGSGHGAVGSRIISGVKCAAGALPFLAGAFWYQAVVQEG